MYTRSYYPEEEGINIPRNYDGNAFNDSGNESAVGSIEIPKSAKEVTKISPRDTVELDLPSEIEPYAEEIPSDTDEDKDEVPVFKGLQIGKFLPDGLRSIFKFDSFHIGTEEILIIAVALFLMFSKGGDKECSIILLLLLLIN